MGRSVSRGWFERGRAGEVVIVATRGRAEGGARGGNWGAGPLERDDPRPGALPDPGPEAPADPRDAFLSELARRGAVCTALRAEGLDPRTLDRPVPWPEGERAQRLVIAALRRCNDSLEAHLRLLSAD